MPTIRAWTRAGCGCGRSSPRSESWPSVSGWSTSSAVDGRTTPPTRGPSTSTSTGSPPTAWSTGAALRPRRPAHRGCRGDRAHDAPHRHRHLLQLHRDAGDHARPRTVPRVRPRRCDRALPPPRRSGHDRRASVLAAWVLAPPGRLPAALLGVGALFLGFPFVKTIALGQGNELVMLGITVGIWAARATVGAWRGSASAGHGAEDQPRAARRVPRAARTPPGAPPGDRHRRWLERTRGGSRPSRRSVGVGTRRVTARVARHGEHLQPVPGRLDQPDLHARQRPVGERSPGAVTWWRTRSQPGRSSPCGACGARLLEPLELGIVVLMAVLAGPLSWDHYATWASIPLVLTLDVTRWARPAHRADHVLTSRSVSRSCCCTGDPVPSPASVAVDWSLRIGSGPYTIALLIWLGVAWWLLARPPARDPAPAPHDAATVAETVAREQRAIAVGEPA